MAAPRTSIEISSEAFDELTGALREQGVNLDNDSEFTVKKNIAIKGPILYRQVNLRHEILKEVVKAYEPKVDAEREFCLTDSKHFIDFFDDVYNYVLTGKKPSATVTQLTPTPKEWK